MRETCHDIFVYDYDKLINIMYNLNDYSILMHMLHVPVLTDFMFHDTTHQRFTADWLPNIKALASLASHDFFKWQSTRKVVTLRIHKVDGITKKRC